MAATISGDSSEAVAYALMFEVLHSQGKTDGVRLGKDLAEADILALYGRCISVVRSGTTDDPDKSGWAGYSSGVT